MAVNKVIYENDTLIDLTNDTATEADVVSGKTFHKKNGVAATGTASLAKPEQTKTVTATTSQQTVTPDSGKVLSSVTVNPQSHTETYTPAANTASNDMGANHKYRFVDTKSMYHVNSIIVPDNSSPPKLDSGEVYKMSELSPLGYAIESYTNVTPPEDGEYFPSGFVKMSSSGYAFSFQKLKKFGIAPDAYKIGKLNGGSSMTLAVTQKPRFLMWAIAGSIDILSLIMVDVNNNLAFTVSFWSNADHSADYSSEWKKYITTLSNTSVVFKNVASAQRRVLLACYYE